MTKKMDAEIIALKATVKALNTLDHPTVQRVLTYLYDRYRRPAERITVGIVTEATEFEPGALEALSKLKGETEN